MYVLTSKQIRQLDAYTIENKPISSLNLMESAALAFAGKVMEHWAADEAKAHPIVVLAGPGNNGGDALAVARILLQQGYRVDTFLFNTGTSLSDDCLANREQLLQLQHVGVEVSFHEVTTQFTPPVLTHRTLVIDGLFGTGLNRPLNGGFAAVVKYVNNSHATVYAIDMPSGLMSEDNSTNIMSHVIQADCTFTFQHPKLALLFPENELYVGHWETLDIGLFEPTVLSDELLNRQLTTDADVCRFLKHRKLFAHKGMMGHALLRAGRKNMAGAAILAARGCMRSGVGKLTVSSVEDNRVILQTTIPEAILASAAEADAFGIGPGIGTDPMAETDVTAFISMASRSNSPLVVDADAINILSKDRDLIDQLPPNTILTPHRGELSRLIGETSDSYELLEKTEAFAKITGTYIVVKGRYSAVVTPDEGIFFNVTGNAGMATAGSGDVLTGIILSLLAQGYEPLQAARLGVYLHGLAGDIAAESLSEESLLASDIIDYLPHAFRRLKYK